MTAVLSPSPPPASATPRHATSPAPHPKRASLPPPASAATTPRTRPYPIERPSSYAKSRMSTYSTTSTGSAAQRPTRPPSQLVLVPGFHSSLTYTVVRDFAYPPADPMHYGPPPERSPASSGRSTPAPHEAGFLAPMFATGNWDTSKANSGWSVGTPGPGEHLPRTAYGGAHDDGGGGDGPRARVDHGPPYSEDEDLHSPVVVSSRHRGWPNHREERNYLAGVNGDGSATYYLGQADETPGGPGGELVTYPPDHPRHARRTRGSPRNPDADDGSQPGRVVGSRRHPTLDPDRLAAASASAAHPTPDPESRYSRDYQFTIASPDEEMHGKAVALFDFARENENELPLAEGQVVWVSYRHGHGWLVAEDPKTRESGLVPEAYVRLLRDIEGGWGSFGAAAAAAAAANTTAEGGGEGADDAASPPAAGGGGEGGTADASPDALRPPVVSTFSTSSRDLDPYPHPLPGVQAGQAPPEVVHYGSRPGSGNNRPAGSHPASPELKENRVDRKASARRKKGKR